MITASITNPYTCARLFEVDQVGLDVESFSNFFCVGITDFKGNTHSFVYDKFQDDRKLLFMLLDHFDKKQVEVVTFNGIHYDCPVLNYARLNPQSTTEDIKRFSDMVITQDYWWGTDGYKIYRYHQKWKDIDLFLYWSKLQRITKKISLKGLAIQLKYPVIQELPVKPNEPVPDNMRMEVLTYNAVHDLGILRYLMEKPFKLQGKKTSFNEEINLRKKAIEKYNFDKRVLSYDAVKLGLQVALNRAREIPPPRMFNLFQEVINPLIKFDTPKFNTLLDDIKQTPREHGLHKTIGSGGLLFELKQGGLHSKNKPCIYFNKPGYIFHSLDVSGYYPALAETLKCKLYEELSVIRKERLDLKHKGLGKTPEANLLKLAANGTVGNFNQEVSPIYDPFSFYSITINGQLFLLMLLEKGISLGCIPIMANTDGFELYVPEDKYDEFMDICKSWEKYTGFELEHFRYKALYMLNVNSYLGVFDDGSIKEKGWFVTDPDLGNKVDFLILPKALQNYLLYDIPFDETFSKASIYDFCAAQKVDRSYEMYHGNIVLPQRLNVYYASLSGNYLFKSRHNKKYALSSMKGVKTTIFNRYKPGPYNIDYGFYKARLEDVLLELGLTSQQLTLFL